jgi:glycosyltransferase involved in cell wall biosynthesis
MKIAIFHNFMDNIGGAEIVGLTLARELNADIYTTNIDKSKIKKLGFENVRIISIGNIPLNAPFRQQMALWKFRKLDLKSKYDFYIIDGDWAMSGAVNNKPNIWYVHSPIREIWDLYTYTRQNDVPWYGKWLFDLWVLYNQKLNRQYVRDVGTLVCNSKNTQNRVKKYLHQKATVIHPPTEVSKYAYKKCEDYWLSVNRLIAHKRVQIQLKAFSKMPNKKLIIVGSYEDSRHFQKYANYIHEIKPPNVEVLSWIEDSELIELYSNCIGFITTSIDEDFGMTVVEAMSSGKPVIAPNDGGYMETIIPNKTGILIDEIDEYKLIKAVNDIEKIGAETFKRECLKQAKKFDVNNFIKAIKNEIVQSISQKL